MYEDASTVDEIMNRISYVFRDDTSESLMGLNALTNAHSFTVRTRLADRRDGPGRGIRSALWQGPENRRTFGLG